MLPTWLASPIAGHNRELGHLSACIARRHGRSGRTLAWSAVACLLIGCADSHQKAEAASVLRLIDTIRMAPVGAKRHPLDQLRSSSCSAADVCAARDACLSAFSHQVRASQLTSEIQSALRSAGDAALPEQEREPLAHKLVEANVENEQGRLLMPDCERAVTNLRIRRKL